MLQRIPRNCAQSPGAWPQVPRIKPKTVVALEEELLSISWEEMDTTCREWGALGRTLYRRAKCAPPALSCESRVVSLVCQAVGE